MAGRSSQEDLPPADVEATPPARIGPEAIPGIARLAAQAWWHTTEWGVSTGVKATRRLLQAATSAESAASLAGELQESARGYARDLVGITDLEDRVRRAAPTTTGAVNVMAARVARQNGDAPPPAPAAAADRLPTPAEESMRALRARGTALLQLSSDVRYEEDSHPAYVRMLDELAPDEGRILRFLYLDGPQPAIDVRTGGPIGLLSSELIAPGLTMIGARAGVRYSDRVPSYLNNLHRLGMLWFSRETLRDVHRYQVIEAQPDVLEAMHSVRFAKLVRRSIHLTPFGIDFCRDCLGLAPSAGATVPVHGAPDDDDGAQSPPPPHG